jgi:serine/threonine-protein kinase HipA
VSRPRLHPTLDVFSEQILVGRLWLDGGRHFLFQYDASWLKRADRLALSHSLPLQNDPFPPDQARPFFANLLPESQVRRLVTENLHISERNDYALLEAIGGECAGAFSVWPSGQKPRTEGELRLVSEMELSRWLDNLPRRPLLQALEGLRLSLAGAQDKLPVVAKGKEIYLGEGSFASSHILKPSIERLEDSVLNEAFCLRLGAAAGLPVASAEVRETPKRYLLVERYDRTCEASGRVKRLHQEDFCQALGILPENKYEAEGGPGLVDCFRVLSAESVHLLEDRRNLLRWTIFNVLIGNADAHAKNIALLRTSEGVQLAPFYDLLSTAVYPALATKMAMKIGGENRPDWLQKRHWERFAQGIGVKENLVKDYAIELAVSLPKVANSLLGEFPDSPLLRRLMDVVEKNAGRIASRLDFGSSSQDSSVTS